MTAFEDAARAEAERRYPDPVDADTGEPVDDWGYEAYARQAHIAGWEAARDHLAEQEASDAEVIAALGAANRTALEGFRFDAPLNFYSPTVVEAMREALRAAARIRKAGS